MASLSRHQRIVIALSVRILRAGVAGTSQRRVDTIEVRLALRCLLPHCPERWPLELYWDAAAQETEIGRAQGVTAAFNGIVRQLRRAGRYEEATGDLIGRNARTGGDADADGPPGVVHDEEVRRPAGT